jgi:hypothetical protein
MRVNALRECTLWIVHEHEVTPASVYCVYYVSTDNILLWICSGTLHKGDCLRLVVCDSWEMALNVESFYNMKDWREAGKKSRNLIVRELI